MLSVLMKEKTVKAIHLAAIASAISMGWAPWLRAGSLEERSLDQLVTLEKNQLSALQMENEDYFPAVQKAIEKEMESFLPKLDEMVEDHADDSDFQMGAGILYNKYDHRSGGFRDEPRMREALRIDPHNKAALALWTLRDVRIAPARYRVILEHFDSITSNDLNLKAGQVVIWGPDSRSESDLYKYLGDGSGKDVVIKTPDFAKAREILKAKLASEVRDMIEPCNQAEKADPNNALYNYLRAHLHLVLGQDEFAMAELQKGARKRYLSTYFAERRNAMSKVLREGGYSDRVADRITAEYAPIRFYINEELLTPYLMPLCERYAKEKNAKQVNEITEMVLSIARQIREEPLPFPPPYGPFDPFIKQFGDRLEKWVRDQRSTLQKTGASASNSSASRSSNQ
jgi:hypothetical protein